MISALFFMRRFILIVPIYILFTCCVYSNVYNGLILYSNSQGVGASNTYLMNNGYLYINTWAHLGGVVGIPHLNSDRSIIVQTRSQDHSFGNSHGPVGGVFEKLDWAGNILWNYSFYSDLFTHIMILKSCQMEIF